MPRRILFPALATFLPYKNKKSRKKVFTRRQSLCIIEQQLNFTLYGGAPDSIAGERKDKHTVDGVPTIKHST